MFLGRRKKSRDLSAYMDDVDRVWRRGETLEDIELPETMGIIHELVAYTPEAAAAAARHYMQRSESGSTPQRLGQLGVLMGRLTPNNMFPSGVASACRSDSLAMILVTEKAPPRYDRAFEISQKLGELIFHEPESIQVFASLTRDDFVVIQGAETTITCR